MHKKRLTLILFAVAACAQTQERAAITGRVVSASTGAPLKKSSVWLEPFSATRGVNGAPTVALPATTTDAEGRFTLDGVEPGSYFLLGKRLGYLDQGYGASTPQVVGPPIELAAGQSLGDIVLKLTPQSLLFGKVLDEDGDVIPNAQVQVLRASYAGGRRHLVEEAGADSQDDGSFVIGNLVPGRYYLSATVRPIDALGPPIRKVERERYVTTFFPNAVESASAAPIELSPGAEVRGLSVRLRKSAVFHIRGRAMNTETGTPAAQVFLRIAGKDEVPGDTARSVATGSDGRFEFDGILPGVYTIDSNPTSAFVSIHGAAPPTPLPSPLVGRATVAVTDGNVEDLVVRVGAGDRITGMLRGATGTISLKPGQASATTAEDGAFELDGLGPDIYTLDVSGLPEGSYVKAINFAGRPVEDWKIDLTSGAGGALFIAVSPDAGGVSGVVRDSKGNPARDATVQIWPAGGDTARTAKSGVRGEFRFHSLPPAEYRVAAFQELDDDLAQYAPFRAHFEGEAAAVKIAEKSRENVELKLIGRDAIAVEAAKLK